MGAWLSLLVVEEPPGGMQRVEGRWLAPAGRGWAGLGRWQVPVGSSLELEWEELEEAGLHHKYK